MINELLFICHAIVVGLISFGAAMLGQYALVSWVSLQGVLANLLVLKQVDLFGLTVTCSDVYSVGGILSLNLLQEKHGKDAAQRAIIAGFALMLAYVCMTQFQRWYTPSSVDLFDVHYAALFAYMPRLIGASMATYLAVQLFDARLYARLQHLFAGRLMMVRSAISLFISQILDTGLFTLLGMYGMAHALQDIFLMSLAVKLVVILCILPTLALLSARAPSK